MNKICKFNHQGDCCNSGSIRFPNKCIGQCGAFVPLTQYERIKQMSVEEMAEFITDLLTVHLNKYSCDIGYGKVVLAEAERKEVIKQWREYFESEVEEK